MANTQTLISKEQTQSQNRIWVRISSACNNKCIFCLDSEAHNGTFTDENEVKKEIKNGFKPGEDNRVIISGGEASVNPKFAQYIKYAKEVGYDRIQTVTNGMLFSNEEFCKKVFDAGLQEVTFSIHGHNEKLHDYLVDTPGAFKKVLKGLIFIKKNYPKIIINIDIVVNKINVKFLPEMVKFFMKFGVYEFDILQIIPFGRGFSENKEKLFYNIEENIEYLHKTWELSKIPGMYMWTNRFPAEAFEGYEDLIQDPRKIKGEVMGEGREMFDKFIKSKGEIKPDCFGEKCDYCFQKQYCYDFLRPVELYHSDENQNQLEVKTLESSGVSLGGQSKKLEGEYFPSQVYEKYGENKNDFVEYLQENKNLINVPKCLGGNGFFETYLDLNPKFTLEDYTEKYIKNLYRKKSLRCRKCKYNGSCEGIHINFIRSYGFSILEPVLN